MPNSRDNSLQTPQNPPAPHWRDLPERLWFNVLWFQATWFVCVLGRDKLVLASLAMIGLHLWLVQDRGAELRLLLPLALLGIGVDSTLALTGVYHFDSSGPIPLWLCCLWFAFAATLTRGLGFLRKRPVLAFFTGLIAPLNYLAGEHLGAVGFGLPLGTTLIVLVPLWGLLLPALSQLAYRLRPELEARP